MKKIDLGQTVSIVANLGVIVGIAFLAIELNQNNALLSAEARATELAQLTQSWGFVAENDKISELLIKDRNGEVLTESEELRLNAHWMRNLLTIQWQYQEAPESTGWTAGQSRNFEAYGSFRRTWEGGGPGSRQAGKDNFDSSFVEFFDANVASR